MQTGILLGLTAALCWGMADFCARGASRASGVFTTLLVVQVLGIVGLLMVGLPLGLLHLAGAPPRLVLAAGGISVLIMAGGAFLYRAFAVGTLALVSPIAAGFASITALLALLAGEHPSPLVLTGIVLTLAGVIVASTVPDTKNELRKDVVGDGKDPAGRRWRPARGLVEALGAMLTFGVGYWLLRFVTPQLGGVATALIGRLADFVVLATLAIVFLLRRVLLRQREHALYRRRLAGSGPAGQAQDAIDTERAPIGAMPQVRPTLSMPPPVFWLFVVPTALLDTTANVAYNVGITVALTSVVAVLSSLFSAVTVLLAWIFLRERLAGWQWAGVAAILVGIALVNL